MNIKVNYPQDILKITIGLEHQVIHFNFPFYCIYIQWSIKHAQICNLNTVYSDIYTPSQY